MSSTPPSSTYPNHMVWNPRLQWSSEEEWMMDHPTSTTGTGTPTGDASSRQTNGRIPLNGRQDVGATTTILKSNTNGNSFNPTLPSSSSSTPMSSAGMVDSYSTRRRDRHYDDDNDDDDCTYDDDNNGDYGITASPSLVETSFESSDGGGGGSSEYTERRTGRWIFLGQISTIPSPERCIGTHGTRSTTTTTNTTNTRTSTPNHGPKQHFPTYDHRDIHNNNIDDNHNHNHNIQDLTTATILVEERLSITLDSNSNDDNNNNVVGGSGSSSSEPSCRIMGRLYVLPTTIPERSGNSSIGTNNNKNNNNAIPPPDFFYLNLADSKQQIDEWNPQWVYCDEVTTPIPTSTMTTPISTNHTFRIDTRHLPPSSASPYDDDHYRDQDNHHRRQQQHQHACCVLEYSGIPRTKLVPLLIKTKVLHDDAYRCRLAIRIRANPNNTHVLSGIQLMVVVPSTVYNYHDDTDDDDVNDDVNDHNEESSSQRKTKEQEITTNGAIWDGMKRTLNYTCEQLRPGDMVDWHAVFPPDRQQQQQRRHYDDSKKSIPPSPMFPMILQCHGQDHLFSRLDVTGTTYETPSQLMKLNMIRKTSVLFRKVH